ncbi:pentapeptide repeat-containing protein, partial [Coleofasciculus sp. FACHB-712]
MKLKFLAAAAILLPLGLVAPVRAENPAHVRRLIETKQCQNCDLKGANLVSAHLTGADLRGANLQGANLANANLEGADLTQANLEKANLTGVFANSADLQKA